MTPVFQEEVTQAVARAQALERRRLLSANEVATLSQRMIERFLNEPQVQPLKKQPLCVGLYRALPQEVDLSFLEKQACQYPWRFFFPRILSHADKALEFVEVPGGSLNRACWQKKKYAFEEPQHLLRPALPSILDCIFVPGVAFGQQGERVGMGYGYYDRFLPQASNALRIALAFDFQVFSRLQQSPVDQPVHWVLTETRTWETRAIQKEWGRFQ